MPTYEYECCVCHHHFDRKQSFDEEPVAECPKCQGKARRAIVSIPVIFKGSGFYATDYRVPNTAENLKETVRDMEAEKRGKGTTEGKTGAKAEGKTEGKKG